MYGCSKDCLTLIPFRLPQISCSTLSLKCFSSDSDNCPTGDWTPVSAPQPVNGKSSPTNTPVFPSSSSSYQVLRGSIYSFQLVRSSCPLPAVVLHALLCLEVYSWCIHGERCTPCPPILPPSCSPQLFGFLLKYPQTCSARHLVFCIQVYIFFTRFIYR